MTFCLDHKKLLWGRYEAEQLPSDFSSERNVPDFAFNVLNPLGLLYRPVVDEHYLENGGKKPVWPNGKPFAVCFTHDVDTVSAFSLSQSTRKFRYRLSNVKSHLEPIRRTAGYLFEISVALYRSRRRDPLHCMERWLQIENQISARSTFFFWPGLESVFKRHESDCQYYLSDSIIFDGQHCSVSEMIHEIGRRGWEIGLHPSWYSFDDEDEIKRQKEALEKVLGYEIVSVRQHHLHYDIRLTPAVHAKAGFKYDSTLGFNDNIGFRFGTCYPYHLYDLKTEKELPIKEMPLIIQDGAMLSTTKGMRLDENTAFQYIVQITNEVEKVGGILTVLWHPNNIIKPDWWKLYLRALEYLKKKNALFGSVREIGQWWKKIKGNTLAA